MKENSAEWTMLQAGPVVSNESEKTPEKHGMQQNEREKAGTAGSVPSPAIGAEGSEASPRAPMQKLYQKREKAEKSFNRMLRVNSPEGVPTNMVQAATGPKGSVANANVRTMHDHPSERAKKEGQDHIEILGKFAD